MGVRTMGYLQRFNKYKNKGMSDDEAAKAAMKEATEETIKANKAEAEKKKKPNWAEKLKMGVTKHLGKKYHSPAGRKYLAGKVKKYGK